MNDKLIEKIKTRGYWRFNFQPLTAEIRLDTMQKCKEVVEKNSVSLRGWDFPHIPRRNDENSGMASAATFYEGWEDWVNHKEFWHIYKTGQFLYYRGLREDWLDEDEWRSKVAEEIKPGSSLGVVGSVIYEITEAFLFLSRLAKNGLYEEGVNVNITLNNTKDRELWIEDPLRASFMYPRKTSAENIFFEKKYTKEEIVNNYKDIANKLILYIFDSFEFNPPPEQIEKDQEKLLTGRI